MLNKYKQCLPTRTQQKYIGLNILKFKEKYTNIKGTLNLTTDSL